MHVTSSTTPLMRKMNLMSFVRIGMSLNGIS
jgi:hypothetical protein